MLESDNARLKRLVEKGRVDREKVAGLHGRWRPHTARSEHDACYCSARRRASRVYAGQPATGPAAFSFFQRNALSVAGSVLLPLADHETVDPRAGYIAPRHTFVRGPALGPRSINPLARIRSLLTYTGQKRGLSRQNLEEVLGEGICQQEMDAIHFVYEAFANVGVMLDLPDGVADDEHNNGSV